MMITLRDYLIVEMAQELVERAGLAPEPATRIATAMYDLLAVWALRWASSQPQRWAA